MIKATMECTNCKKERDIPRDELSEALCKDNVGELSLCTDCEKLWDVEVDKYRANRNKEFALLQGRFGILIDED